MDTHEGGTAASALRGSNLGIDAHPLAFSGSGGEYFRVWIVNVLLTIVTFGFYTPFARRRTAQYFYGHTLVAGSPLEFTAPQKKMVLGFIILVALYVAFQVAAETGQEATVAVMMMGGAVLAPYFWGSAMRFRMGATRWRGVRLQFAGTWGEVYRAAWPLFAIAAIWIANVVWIDQLIPDEQAAAPGVGQVVPVVVSSLVAVLASVALVMRLEFNYKSLMVARGRVGGQVGRWKPVFGDFVRIWLATLGLFLGCVLLFVLVVALLAGGTFAIEGAMKKSGVAGAILAALLGVLAVVLGLVLVSAPARAYREARMFQLIWNNIGVSHMARFKCDLRAKRYVMLRVRNVLLAILTLGFWRPFALVSEYRMKAESVTLHVKGGLDQLAGQLAREEQGLGDALADAVGLDLVG
jgi:uncharacterized membrane protein YjgN (DUF898 family)